MGCEIMPSRCEVLYRVKSGQCEGSFAVSPVPAAFGKDYALSWFIPGNLKGREVNGMGFAVPSFVPRGGG